MTATFTAPGPGSWQLDGVHFPHPVTKLFAEVFPRSFDAGFREGARIYGSLLETIEFGTVNRFLYFTPRPVGAPKSATKVPPKLLFQFLLRVHPELRRRVASGRDTVASKRWRQDLSEWDKDRKPAAVAAHLALQAVDLGALNSGELVAHLDKSLAHWRRMIEQHHRFDAAALLPVGDFIAHAAGWTGLEPARLCTLLAGASDVSSGGSPELDRLQKALRADPNTLTLLDQAKSPGEAIANLRTARGDLGVAARDWLNLVSFRLQNGLDICELTNAELPELLLTTVRRALSGTLGHPAAKAADTTAIRDRVAAEHRSQFDELLAEARLMYRLRDERGLYSDIWAAGIFRHAVLEAGRRLVATGRLEQADLLVEADADEMRALLTNGTAPSSAELAERAKYRSTASPAEAPATLGPASGGPPPAAWMPRDTARLESAIGMGIAGIWTESSAPSEARLVRGLGVSAGLAEGIARVVQDVNGFGKLKQGDILVTRSTTAAFNVVLPLLAGIVTDRGGTLSHSAIVAREYGIPAVVGSREATRLIPDGARIRVDGTLGEAVIL
ncbi:MAG TPA: PEP-utilizing enzyme [Vicinamibacterales bacterium]